MAGLREEIRAKEAELRRLEEEASKLRGLAPGAVPTAAGVTRRAGRINLRTVLTELPEQFNASNLRSLRPLTDKRSSEIFAAITRWIDAGLVKRKARGLYELVKQSKERKPKKAT
ncbi:MAG: hypothetical protein ACLQU2_31135 [Candidatus Binataceae bacterium]